MNPPIGKDLISEANAPKYPYPSGDLCGPEAYNLLDRIATLLACDLERPRAIAAIASLLDSAFKRALVAKETENTRLRAKVEQLKGAIALGQKNCDAAYDEFCAEAFALRKANDTRIDEFLNEKICCNGVDCGCGGVTRLQQLVQEESGRRIGELRAELAAAKKKLFLEEENRNELSILGEQNRKLTAELAAEQLEVRRHSEGLAQDSQTIHNLKAELASTLEMLQGCRHACFDLAEISRNESMRREKTETELAKAREDSVRFVWAVDHPNRFAETLNELEWGMNADLNAIQARTAIDDAIAKKP